MEHAKKNSKSGTSSPDANSTSKTASSRGGHVSTSGRGTAPAAPSLLLRPPESRRPSDSSRSITAADTPPGRAKAPSAVQYRYVVLPGNESVLLREALQRRPWWVEAPEGGGNQRWNLWAGLNGQRFNQFDLLPSEAPPPPHPQPAASQPPRVSEAAATSGSPSSRRLVNRLEEHRIICTKSGLATVLAAIQAAARTATATHTTGTCPTTSQTSPGTGNGRVDSQRASSIAQSPIPDADALKSGCTQSDTFRGPMDISWIPETYVVPAGPKAAAAGGVALSRFKAAFAAHAGESRRVWIAKPTCLNRGNGIEVFDSLERILDHLKNRPADSSLILQKYIERPLLLGGRKFDIRAYVLVGPDGSVWFHKEAYCRTSSTPYDSTDLTNRSAHLTNDAVQKHLDTYNAFEDHCKLSLEQLGPALQQATATTTTTAAAAAATAGRDSNGNNSHGANGSNERAPSLAAPGCPLDTRPGSDTGLWGAMRHCAAALFSVAGPRLNPRRRLHCFELLGLDFMLDANGRLYLIEVNTSPALFRAGAYLSDLLPRLVEEVVQRVVDPLFPPPTQMEAAVRPATEALDGFVRVDLDGNLATAAAAGVATGKTAGSATKAGKGSPRPGPGGDLASGTTTGRRAPRPVGPSVIATAAGGVRAARHGVER